MIVRSKKQDKYSVIDNEVYKANVLTFEAQGMLSNILSKPDGWSVLPCALVKSTEGTRKPSKINSVYTILRELKDAGFVVMKRLTSGKVQYTVFDSPSEKDSHTAKSSEVVGKKGRAKKPNDDYPHEAQPREANHHDIVSTNTLINTKKSSIPNKLVTDGQNTSMANDMFDKLKIINPTMKKPNLNIWEGVIKKIRSDGNRTLPDIQKAFDWAITDNFWRNVVVDPYALDRSFDKITMQMKASESRLPSWEERKKEEQEMLDDDTDFMALAHKENPFRQMERGEL